jgi:hypothetical protein
MLDPNQSYMHAAEIILYIMALSFLVEDLGKVRSL